MRTVADLVDSIKADSDLEQRIKSDPVQALSKLAYTADKTFYRYAIVGLIIVILAVIVSAAVMGVWAVPEGNDPLSLPDGIIALGATAIGGLVGLFAPSPTGQ
jgi:uncharacterized integral membrane protein